jgi:hypothetical protein
MLQANPTLSRNRVEEILKSSAIPFGDSDVSGNGLIQANEAVLLALCPSEWHPFFSDQGKTGLWVASASVSQTPSGAVGTGSTVRIVLRMNERVAAVSGTPTLTLNDGAIATYNAGLSNLTAGQLVFDYTVGTESTQNLQVIKVNLPSGAPYDLDGNNADFSGILNVPTNLSINSPLSAAIVPQSGEANAGQSVYLTLTMSEAVAVNTSGGAPTLTLSNGGTAAYDASRSNPAAGKLVFDYTVGTNDNTPSLTVAQVNLPAGTTIRDTSGNNADFSAALEVGTGLQIGPLSAEFIASSQSEAGTGQTVQRTLQLTGGINVNTAGGSPKLALSDGATATYDAAASNLSAGTLVFDYKVGGNDHAANVAASLNVNGATIQDNNGVNVNLSAASNVPTGLTVNSPLKVTSVTPSPASGIENTGQTILFALNLTETASVDTLNGTPTLALNDGGTAVYAGGDGSNVLTFSYTVAPSDTAVSSLAITAVNLNTATVVDSSGNNADFSGALKTFSGLRINHVETPPTVTVANVALSKNQTLVAASSLFTASDQDGGTITQFAFWAAGTGGGHLVLNGASQATNQEIDVTAAQLTQLQYQAGSGADTLWVAAYDGTQWSGTASNKWSAPFTVVVSTPTLSVNSNATALRGQTLALSTLVTIADPDAVGYQKLELWDSNGTAAGGQFVVNGVAQTGGHEIDVSPANVARTMFDVGTSVGSDTLYAQLLQNNGQATGWKSFAVTVPAPALVVYDDPNATRGQQVALPTLLSILDPAGIGYSQLELWDSSGTAAGGQFVVNGVAQTGGHEIDVSPGNVAGTMFDVGPSVGSDTLYAQLLQSNGQLTGWQSFTVTVPAPSLAVSSISNATRGQQIALSNLVSISDPAGISYSQLELWDSNGIAAGGQFVVNGVAQTGGHEIDVAPANVAGTLFDAGTTAGTDPLYARLLQSNGQLTPWQQFSVTVPAPTLAVSSISNATRGQQIALSSLVTISDTAGVGYSQLELWDSNGTAAGGQFVVNSAAQTGGHEIDVIPAHVAGALFDASTMAGTDTLYARLLQTGAVLPRRIPGQPASMQVGRLLGTTRTEQAYTASWIPADNSPVSMIPRALGPLI